MKKLLPINSENNRVINAIEFNDSSASILATLAASTELEIDVPPRATLARFIIPVDETVYISNESGITIPVEGAIEASNAEINPGIRVLPLNGSRKLYALSEFSVTLGIAFYVQ